MTHNICACLGPQGNDPVCPCMMRSQGLEPSNQWTEEDRQRLNAALNDIFFTRKQNESNSME